MQQTADAKAAWAAYQREWRKRNPDKCKEIRRRYWEKKAAEAMNVPKDGDKDGKQ